MTNLDKIRIKFVEKLFKEKFPALPGILLNIRVLIYYFIVIKDILKYNYFLSFLFYKQERFKIDDNTEIIYVDHQLEHYELTKLHKGIQKLDIILFNKIFFVFEKTYPYFILHHLNNKIKILHIGTIEFFSLFNIDPFIKYCKKNNIYLISTYHSFGVFEENIELLKEFNLVIALSDKFRAELELNGIKNVIVNCLPSSYTNIKSPDRHDARMKLNINTEKIIFSFVGNFRSDKGYDFFLNAIQSLDKKYKDKIFLNFAGPIGDNTYNIISGILPNTGIDYRLKGTKEYLSDEEFVYNIAISDAYIIPYTRDTINASGPLIEAACRKIPIIGTDNGDIGYTINKWNIGITFKHKDEVDLKKKIIDFIDKRGELNLNFDKFIKDHSPENFTEKHKMIYNDILNDKFLIDNYR